MEERKIESLDDAIDELLSLGYLQYVEPDKLLEVTEADRRIELYDEEDRLENHTRLSHTLTTQNISTAASLSVHRRRRAWSGLLVLCIFCPSQKLLTWMRNLQVSVTCSQHCPVSDGIFHQYASHLPQEELNKHV